ncbi:hypothetical protein C8R47DRAFT_744430 [Mycena vitilis]|nr:hypothetical protein C8R47DRAFT_744430 [Mycena vitilis]
MSWLWLLASDLPSQARPGKPWLRLASVSSRCSANQHILLVEIMVNGPLPSPSPRYQQFSINLGRNWVLSATNCPNRDVHLETGDVETVCIHPKIEF